MENIQSVTKLFTPLFPQTVSATKKTGIVDGKGGGTVEFDFSVGANSEAYSSSNKYTCTIQHSDTDADTGFAAVTDPALVVGLESALGADITTGIVFVLSSSAVRDLLAEYTHRVSYLGAKRYSRLVFTKGASAPNFLVGVTAHLDNPKAAGATSTISNFGFGNSSATEVAAS